LNIVNLFLNVFLGYLSGKRFFVLPESAFRVWIVHRVVQDVGRLDGLEGLCLGFESPAELEVVLAPFVGHSNSTWPATGTQDIHPLGHILALNLVNVGQALYTRLPGVLFPLTFIVQLQQPLHCLFSLLFVCIGVIVIAVFHFLGLE